MAEEGSEESTHSGAQTAVQTEEESTQAEVRAAGQASEVVARAKARASEQVKEATLQAKTEIRVEPRAASGAEASVSDPNSEEEEEASLRLRRKLPRSTVPLSEGRADMAQRRTPLVFRDFEAEAFGASTSQPSSEVPGSAVKDGPVLANVPPPRIWSHFCPRCYGSIHVGGGFSVYDWNRFCPHFYIGLYSCLGLCTGDGLRKSA